MENLIKIKSNIINILKNEMYSYNISISEDILDDSIDNLQNFVKDIDRISIQRLINKIFININTFLYKNNAGSLPEIGMERCRRAITKLFVSENVIDAKYSVHPGDPFEGDTYIIFDSDLKEYVEENGNLLVFTNEADALDYIDKKTA